MVLYLHSWQNLDHHLMWKSHLWEHTSCYHRQYTPTETNTQSLKKKRSITTRKQLQQHYLTNKNIELQNHLQLEPLQLTSQANYKTKNGFICRSPHKLLTFTFSIQKTISFLIWVLWISTNKGSSDCPSCYFPRSWSFTLPSSIIHISHIQAYMRLYCSYSWRVMLLWHLLYLTDTQQNLADRSSFPNKWLPLIHVLSIHDT